MKKVLRLIIVALTLASLLLAGCGQNQPASTAGPDQSAQPSNTATATPTPSATPTATPTPEPITLSYMNWNLGTAEENNLERQMIAKYMELHPNVTVNIVEVPLKEDGTAGDYGAYLNTLASKKELPDVYMWTSVPDTAAAGWACSLTEYSKADPDFQAVVPAIRDGSIINGNTYALPFAMHVYGFCQNYSIFNELNVDPLPYSYTMDDLVAKLGATTTDKYRGTDNFCIEDWGAFVLNNKIGYGTFDGTKYNFSSPEFAKAIDIYKEIVTKGWTGNGSYTGPWLPEGVGWAWGEGYVAIQYDADWTLYSIATGQMKFTGDMVPLPNEKVIVIPDYIFVGANTKNAQASYDLAKWMSFGLDGMRARMAIMNEKGIAGNFGLPLNAGTDKALDDNFLKAYANCPNFLKIYASLKEKPENAILEGFKVVPGYTKSRFEGDTGVVGKVGDTEKSMTMSELIVSIIKGDKQLADYAAEMDKVANKFLEDAKANLPK